VSAKQFRLIESAQSPFEKLLSNRGRPVPTIIRQLRRFEAYQVVVTADRYQARDAEWKWQCIATHGPATRVVPTLRHSTEYSSDFQMLKYGRLKSPGEIRSRNFPLATAAAEI